MVNKKATSDTSVFTYNISCTKGQSAPVIKQDEIEPTQQPIPLQDTNQQLNRFNKWESLRIPDIVAAALNQFIGSVFLKEMRCTVTFNNTPP